MTTVYIEEIFDDDDGPPTHTEDGEVIEQMDPVTMPVHTLTQDMVAAHASGDGKAAAGDFTPADAEALRLKGNEAFGKKKFDDALQLYSEAITLDGSNGLLYGNRAATLMQLGRHQQAVSDAKQMVLLLPDLAKAHFRLGTALSASGQPADAARSLHNALEIDPTNDSIAESLKKELSKPSLKKGKQHSDLVNMCQYTLNNRNGGGNAAANALPRLPWKEVTMAKGAKLPAKRGGMALCAASGRLWLIAGADRTGEVHSDVWEYVPAAAAVDVSDGAGAGGAAQWVQHADCGEGFRERSGHAACVAPVEAGGDVILVYGGQDPRSSVLLDDLSMLRVPKSSSSTTGVKWDTNAPSPIGSVPEARNGHSFTYDESGKCAYVFGGANSDSHLDDVHRLMLPPGYVGGGGEPAKWEAPAVSGPKPHPREMHVTGIVKRNLIVHGGRGGDNLLSDVCVLALETMTWAASIPTQITRVGHAIASISGGKDDATRLLFFGGFTGENFANDTYELMPNGDGPFNIGATTCVKLLAESMPPRRFAHGMAAIENVMYVFGGSSASEDLNTLHEADASECLKARAAK